MRCPRARMGWRVALAGLVLANWLSGCATSPMKGQRLARYQPRITAADREFPDIPDNPDTPPEPVGVSTNQGVIAADQPVVKPTSARRLKRGDRVAIHLRSIPTPQDIHDEIDGDGDVNLDLIGTIHLEGTTTSEAEKMIEKAYIEGKYYTQITVIVVAQADEYFLRGEIKSPGKYSLTGDMTLLKAIAAAGGYTDYHNPKKITIYRGEQVLRFNAVRIEAGKDEDPLIEPGDIIVIGRRWV